ncbi:MAG: hypothetical protein V4727_13445 [Verrucomicrobiota bacterium]
MKVTKSSPLVLAVILACTSTLPAQLPSIDKEPWENYFIALKERKFQFGITKDGEAVFYPLTKRGEIISERNPIIFKIEVLESKSDGKFTSKKIVPGSLKSDQPAALNPAKPVTYSGSVTGDATFEITITPSRDGFAITGKITGKGTLTDNLHVAISMGLRPYPKDTTRTAVETKAFEQRVRRDKFQAIIASGNKKAYDFPDGANLHIDMPQGVESLSMKSEGYDSTEFTVSVGGSSKIMFEDKNQIIFDGVDFQWIIPTDANPAIDVMKISAK